MLVTSSAGSHGNSLCFLLVVMLLLKRMSLQFGHWFCYLKPPFFFLYLLQVRDTFHCAHLLMYFMHKFMGHFQEGWLSYSMSHYVHMNSPANHHQLPTKRGHSPYFTNECTNAVVVGLPTIMPSLIELSLGFRSERLLSAG